MNVAALDLPLAWVLGTWTCALAILGWAVPAAMRKPGPPGDPVRVLPAAVFVLCVLWSIRGHVGDALVFSLLGTPALALLGGTAPALVAGVVVVAVTSAMAGAPAASAALAWLVQVAVPVGAMQVVRTLVARYGGGHPFVYLFGIGVFGTVVAVSTAAVAGLAVVVQVTKLHGLSVPADLAFGEYLPYLVYLACGEATLTGMLLTLAIVYRPEWVATLDAQRLRDA
jgi:uncharacterized membrane protein